MQTIFIAVKKCLIKNCCPTYIKRNVISPKLLAFTTSSRYLFPLWQGTSCSYGHKFCYKPFTPEKRFTGTLQHCKTPQNNLSQSPKQKARVNGEMLHHLLSSPIKHLSSCLIFNVWLPNQLLQVGVIVILVNISNADCFV